MAGALCITIQANMSHWQQCGNLPVHRACSRYLGLVFVSDHEVLASISSLEGSAKFTRPENTAECDVQHEVWHLMHRKASKAFFNKLEADKLWPWSGSGPSALQGVSKHSKSFKKFFSVRVATHGRSNSALTTFTRQDPRCLILEFSNFEKYVMPG